MWRDLRYAIRQIKAKSLFSVLVVSLLGIGIGANALVFTFLNAFLLRPLPVRRPETLYLVEKIRERQIRPETRFDFHQFEIIAQRRDLFLAALAEQEWDKASLVSLNDRGSTRLVTTQIVSPNYFSDLGISAAVGRMLTEADATTAPMEIPVVISYQFWRSQFDGSPSVIGQTIRLKNYPFLVVGVVARSFHGLDLDKSPDVRLPFSAATALRGHDLTDPSSEERIDFRIVVRLASGVAPSEASNRVLLAMQDIGDWSWREWNAHQKQPWPKEWMDDVLEEEHNYRLALERCGRGISQMRTQFSHIVLILTGGVVLLLLVVCANVGGLLLVRCEERRREIAVRLAIGGGRWQILRQLSLENVLLTLVGTLIGVGLASTFSTPLARLIPGSRSLDQYLSPNILDVRPDYRVFLCVAALSACTVILLGVAPAWRQTLLDPSNELKGTSHTIKRTLIGVGAVAVQVALSFVLVVTAALMGRTFLNLEHLNPGFDREHLLDFTFDPRNGGYSKARTGVFFREVKEHISTLPGVKSVAYAGLGVMRNSGIKSTVVPQGGSFADNQALNVSLNAVSPGYFQTMGIPFISGRDLREGDLGAKPKPVVVNKAFADLIFPHQRVVGQYIVTGRKGTKDPSAVIVGEVETAKYRSLREEDAATYYTLLDETSGYDRPMLLYVCTFRDPKSVINGVRSVLRDVDANVPIVEASTVDQEIQDSIWQERLVALLCMFFAAIALILAGIGLYGALSYAVVQGSREFGIRIALGAQTRNIVETVCRRMVPSALFGIGTGLIAAASLVRLTRHFLFGLSPFDPLSFGIAVTVIAFCFIAAAAPPSWRATRTQPQMALRSE